MKQFALNDFPVLKYTPFLSGKYDVTTPVLQFLTIDPQLPEQRLIQLDSEFPRYLANKEACRQEGLNQYYLTTDFWPQTQAQVNQTLIKHFCQSYPEIFTLEQEKLHCHHTGDVFPANPQPGAFEHPRYQSLFDALATQIQEDLALWQWDGQRDWLSALHVCAPNGWAPAEKIGQNFAQVHERVPGMEKQRSNYAAMLQGLIHKPAFYRFIWDLKTTTQLNLNPQAGSSSSPSFNLAQPELYVRVERQVLYGLPECNAVLFLIRTYLYPVQELSSVELLGIIKALKTMAPALYEYKQIAKSLSAILTWLERLSNI